MVDTEIINLTPEAVVIYNKSGTKIKHTYPPSGDIAYIETKRTIAPRNFNGIPLVSISYGEVKGFPQYYPEGTGMGGPVYIVDPDIVKANVVGEGYLVSPDYSPESVVKDKDGHVIGVRCFVRRYRWIRESIARNKERELVRQIKEIMASGWTIEDIAERMKLYTFK